MLKIASKLCVPAVDQSSQHSVCMRQRRVPRKKQLQSRELRTLSVCKFNADQDGMAGPEDGALDSGRSSGSCTPSDAWQMAGPESGVLFSGRGRYWHWPTPSGP